MTRLKEITDEQLQGPFEPVAELARGAKQSIEESGVTLVERPGYGAPGPVRTAAVEIDDGSQFVIVEHYEHPDGFLELLAQVSSDAPREAIRRFSDAAHLRSSDILWTVGQ